MEESCVAVRETLEDLEFGDLEFGIQYSIYLTSCPFEEEGSE